MATTTTKDFQTFKIYLKVARELQSLNPIVSYYLRTFALNKAVELLKIERAQGLDITQKTAEIKEWLQDLEGLKTMLGTELANKENCKQVFQNFTFDLYQKSDMEYRKGAYTRVLAKNFLYVSVLFDAWEILGGQPSDVKEQKNYANQARFKIMESIDNNKDNMNHIKPATTPNAETPGADGNTDEKRRVSLDPLEKLDFGLTESIVVPQSTIDKFLDGTRPDVKIVATNVLNELAEKPKGGRIPPQNNNVNQVGAFKLPMGTSVRIEDNNQNGNNNMYNQNNQGNFAQFNTQGYQQHVPNTVYHPSVQQGPQTNAGYPVRSVFQGSNHVQSTVGQHIQHIPQNQQNQTVLKEIQNKTGAGNQGNQGNMEKEKGELVMRCQEAKDFCLKAASELDFVKVREAKEKIYKALCLLEQLEKQQQC